MLKAASPLSLPAYMRWVMITTVAFVVVVALFNVMIDPLGVFGSPKIVGLNAIKPHLDHHNELVRWQAARRLCPNTGIFGNSRAEIGFDPEHDQFARNGLVAYNHAIPGTGANMAYRQIERLKAAGCSARTILLGVEFFDFLGGAKPREKSLLKVRSESQLDGMFFAETVFSLAGLRDSLATIALQRAPFPAVLTERGFNPLQNYTLEVQQSGQYLLFRQRAEENLRNWSRLPRRLSPLEGGVSDDEQSVDAILVQAAESQSTVFLIIYPYHAQIRVMMELLGLGELFSEWKKLIVAIATVHTDAGQKVEVWDFSGISQQTLETIPAPGDRETAMEYFWESGHFKKALGDLAIAQLLGGQSGFGKKLDRSNVNEFLAIDHVRVQTILTTPSPLLRDVKEILDRQNAR